MLPLPKHELDKLLKGFSAKDSLDILAMVEARIRESKSERQESKKKPLADFKTFIHTYFSHYITAEFGLCQNQLIQDVESFRDRQKRKPIRKTRAMPRGFGKSSIITLFGALWLVLNGEHKFVIILSSSKSTAIGFLQAIIDEVEQNDKLVDDYPQLKPAIDFKGQTVAWRDAEIVFANGVRIMALGWLNSVRGLRKKNHRPDFIICDDPDEEKDVNSETRMDRKYRWFDRAVLRLGGILGVDVFVNYTTISENCVGEYIYKNDQKYSDWDRKKFKAIEIDPKTGKEYSTWEEGAPLEMLLAEREADPLGFATEKQNEPLPEASQKFKGKIQTYTFPPTENWTGWKLALACDLSLGRNEQSDYSAIIGIAMSQEGRFYQIYEDIQRRSPDQIERDLVAALLQFPYSIAGVETSGNQSYFLGENLNSGFRKVVAEYNKTTEKKILTPLVPIDSKGDKISRITGRLQAPISTGLLKLRSDSILLYKQLNEFPHGFKDGPDALDMAYDLLVNAPVVKTSSVVKTTKTVKTAEDVQRERFAKLGFDYDSLKRGFK
jgi:hypothetical protein